MTYCLVAEASLYDIGRYDRASMYITNSKDRRATQFYELFNSIIRLSCGYSNTEVQEQAKELIALALDLAMVPKDVEPPKL